MVFLAIEALSFHQFITLRGELRKSWRVLSLTLDDDDSLE